MYEIVVVVYAFLVYSSYGRRVRASGADSNVSTQLDAERWSFSSFLLAHSPANVRNTRFFQRCAGSTCTPFIKSRKKLSRSSSPSMLFGLRNQRTEGEKREMVSLLHDEFSNEPFAKATIRRFLDENNWDVGKSRSMLAAHAEWRKVNLPIQRTPSIDRVLESGRISNLRRGAEPILLVNFKWGNFISDGITVQDIVDTHVYVLEDVLAEADAAVGNGAEAQYIGVSGAGFPPVSFIKQFLYKTFIPNYAGRLGKTIIYPIPPGWYMNIAKSILGRLPQNIGDKFVLCTSEDEFLREVGLDEEDLPEDLRYESLMQNAVNSNTGERFKEFMKEFMTGLFSSSQPKRL